MKVEELKVNKANPRQIRDEKFKKLKKSVKEFPKMMELRPIVIDDDGTILGGNMRFRALLELGYKEIPDSWVRKASELTDEEKQRFIIEDNVEFGEWDYERLANGWDDELLNEWGLELPTISNEVEANEDDYEIPDEIKTDIVLGDLFEFQKDGKTLHRLLCGDSTDADQVEKLMNGEKADMVFTDPPYLMDFTGGLHGDGSKSFNSKHGRIINDKMSDRDGDLFLDAINSNIILFCKGAFYISFYRLGIDKYFSSMNRTGLQCRALIIWNKGNHTLSNSDYMSMYEPIFYGWVNEHNFYGGNNGRDIWNIERTQKNDLHPTMKPIALCAKGISDGSLVNGIVLDFFLGSGSTMIAAHQLNRKCYGMELDPKYCQVIIDRMLKLDNGLQILKNGIPL